MGDFMGIVTMGIALTIVLNQPSGIVHLHYRGMKISLKQYRSS